MNASDRTHPTTESDNDSDTSVESFEWPTPIFYAQEDELSSSSQEFLLDVSDDDGHQATGLGFDPWVFFRSLMCSCGSGAPCRRTTPSAYSFVSKRQTTNIRPPLLRLRCWQSWEVRSDAGSTTFPGVREQGGPSALEVGRFSESFRQIYELEIRGCCGSDRIWCFSSPDSDGTCWLLLAQQEEGGGFRFLQYYQTGAVIAEVFAIPDCLSQLGPEYQRYHRLVEFQFVFQSTVQIETALPLWTPGFPEDEPHPSLGRVLLDLRYASGGFLRLLR